jgi:hypothetical protein
MGWEEFAMQPWENEFVELLSICGKLSRTDLSEEQFLRWWESDECIDAWNNSPASKNAEAELKRLRVGNLRTEIRRRIKALGGGPILYLRLKHDFTILLRMALKPFKEFKERAAQDPVLKFFWFTHRGLGKKVFD